MKLSMKDKILDDSANQKLTKARKLKQQCRYQQAIQMYHKVIFIKQGIEALTQLAQIYEQILDYSSSLSFYKRALQFMPRPDIKQKIHTLTLLKGLQLLSIGSCKNILVDTQFEHFIQRYDNFHKTLIKKVENSEQSQFSQNLISCLAYLEVNHRQYALDALQNCLMIYEKDSDVLILKGLLYWSLMENKKGYQEFWKAQQISPDHQQVQAFLQMILPKVQSNYKEAKYELISKQLGKCRLLVKNSLQMYPHHTRFLILSSYIYRSRQQYQQALSELELANKTLNKNNQKQLEDELRNQIALTYNQMGVYLFRHEKYEEAIKLFTEGLSYKPKDWGMLSNRGDCYKASNDFVKALSDYQSAYQIEKKTEQLNFKIASIFNIRGIALFNSKNFQHAIKQFNQSIKFYPKCSNFYASKAKCYIQLGLTSEAVDILTQAQRKDPKNTEITQLLANYKQNEEKKIRNNRKVIVLNKEKN